MAILLDSSVLIDLERRAARSATRMERFADETVAVAAITASELLHGVHRARGAQRRARREGFVEAVLGAVAVLPFDLAVARVHARLWADLAASGRKIGAHDLIIAATALANELPLATGNTAEFRRVEHLVLVEGW